jgi:hypothetical protein
VPLRGYLAAIAVFCNEVKGKSALALSRDLGLSYKSAFVLLHKLREAMAEEMKGRVVGGEGKEAEVDGGYFGGYVKPASLKADRIDRRFARNQNGKRKVVVSIRERGGNSVPAVFHSERQASAFIRARIAKGSDGYILRSSPGRVSHSDRVKFPTSGAALVGPLHALPIMIPQAEQDRPC